VNPLLAVGVGWLVLRALGGNKSGAPRRAPRVIDASGKGLRLLPAPATAAPKPKPKPKAPKGTVTLGEPVRVLPVAPAPTRSTAQAAQPVRRPAPAPAPTPKQAAATAAARASLPQVPASAKASVPTPPGTNLPKAKKMAAQVAANVKKGIKLYDRKLVKAFQTAAGLTPDGLYGPVCASALRYFGAVAPAPLFKGQDLKYVPPGG
jgi:hypothetical protein